MIRLQIILLATFVQLYRGENKPNVVICCPPGELLLEDRTNCEPTKNQTTPTIWVDMLDPTNNKTTQTNVFAYFKYQLATRCSTRFILDETPKDSFVMLSVQLP